MSEMRDEARDEVCSCHFSRGGGGGRRAVMPFEVDAWCLLRGTALSSSRYTAAMPDAQCPHARDSEPLTLH